ncbi:MAG TPA: hypothetical protein VJT74_02320, partial [Pyrinomonadaceae bacterium]|nr:hypothetical protein [Pyrinomonadaceae bacterium]
AGLVRALARKCHAQAISDEPITHARPELLRAAKWRAARYGLDADLIDVEEAVARPARQMVEKLLAFLRPALEEHDEWDEISALTHETLSRGNGATRQRETYTRSGSLQPVVDFIVAETRKGT